MNHYISLRVTFTKPIKTNQELFELLVEPLEHLGGGFPHDTRYLINEQNTQNVWLFSQHEGFLFAASLTIRQLRAGTLNMQEKKQKGVLEGACIELEEPSEFIIAQSHCLDEIKQ